MSFRTPKPVMSRVPELVFSMLAWMKLQFLCHAGATEIGAFGIARADNPLYIEDIATVRQTCTSVSVEFDDEATADHFDRQVDSGKTPDQFARLWIHTHPGESPHPSSTDEETFSRVFGACSWAVMFILARGGAAYCRLGVQTPTGPTGVTAIGLTIPVRVDYSGVTAADLAAISPQSWAEEFAANVSQEPEWTERWGGHGLDSKTIPAMKDDRARLDWFDSLEPEEQQAVLDDERQATLDDEREVLLDEESRSYWRDRQLQEGTTHAE